VICDDTLLTDVLGRKVLIFNWRELIGIKEGYEYEVCKIYYLYLCVNT